MYELAFISGPDMIIVMIVALVVFGPKRLPEVGKQLGQAMRELRKMTSDFTDVVHSEMNSVHSVVAPAPAFAPRPGPVDIELPAKTVVNIDEAGPKQAHQLDAPATHVVDATVLEVHAPHGEQK